jgi:hypothetical protein
MQSLKAERNLIRVLMTYRSWAIFLVGFMCSGTGYAQLAQINPSKLPQDQRVKAAYSSASSVESMARIWSPNWTYDTPKERVVSILSSSLQDLRSAEAASPENTELLLLTGLVAHLAYNVDVETAYQAAAESFERAHKLSPSDYRPEWFLGTLHCQSDDIKQGMEQLLGVENQIPWQKLPIDFWDDYTNCSTISVMPAHTLRAVERAEQLGALPSRYGSLVDIAKKRYILTDAETTYPAHEAWQATEEDGVVQFTSQLCGIGFSTHSDWRMDIRDVAKGTCIAVAEPGPYPSKTGQGTPSILVLTQTAKSQETLDEFVRGYVIKYPSARAVTLPSCPSEKCVAFDIVTNAVYQPEGGAHFLVVGFASQPPDFPGLQFETPLAPPKSKPGDKAKYYHPIEKLQRLPGVLYTVVLLDSNDSIFEKAAIDFQYLLKSIQLD